MKKKVKHALNFDRQWGRGVDSEAKTDSDSQAIEPYARVVWEKRSVSVKDSEGRVLFAQADVEIPQKWSQTALEILTTHYLRKSDVPLQISPLRKETSLKHLLERVVLTLLREGQKQKIWANKNSREAFGDDLRYLLVQQMGSFNSPVWFNCGLGPVYGIKAESEAWAWNDKKNQVDLITDAYARPQSSACFILSVKDDLRSIFTLALNEAQIFKFGSGSGTNFSPLRGKQEKLAGGGYSSGLMAFLEVLDRGAAATKSGGLTRRAAKMVTVDVDHPEIFEYVCWKAKEEDKAQILLKAGLSGGLEGEVHHTLSGQNSNNSIRVGNDFMVAVENNSHWSTRARTTGEIINTFPAQELWDQILKSIWRCGDPGIQFEEAIQAQHFVPSFGPIRASNPCAEFMFLDDSACNLASLNLVSFLIDESSSGSRRSHRNRGYSFKDPSPTLRFHLEGFRSAVRTFIVAQDIWVDHSSYPTQKVAENSHAFRPLGLGFTHLGGLLMRLGLPYDSPQARAWAGGIAAWMQVEALATSVELAQIHGPFKGFKENRNPILRILRGCEKKVDELLEQQEFPSYLSSHQKIKERWHHVIESVNKYGLRNAQLTAIAPTGTISLLMDCDTTGIEPEFSLVKIKKMVGGGIIKQVNQALPEVLPRLGYDSQQVSEILEWLNKKNHLQGAPHLRVEHWPIFACSQISTGVDEAFLIKPEAHLEMMAAVQPFMSGAIAKTVNLPENATQQDISRLLQYAWKLGLKSVAFYRYHSKFTQPLEMADEGNQGNQFNECFTCSLI